MGKVIQQRISGAEDQKRVEGLVRSLLLQRWKPPEEWQLVNIVNEAYTSQQPSTDSTPTEPTPITTVEPSVVAPSSSSTALEQLLPFHSDTRRAKQSRRQSLEAFSSWLDQHKHPADQPLYRSNKEHVPHLPSQFKQFTSRCLGNCYLKLSALKSVHRKHVNWNALYQPADLNPFFNLCEQLDSPSSDAVSQKKRKEGTGVATPGSVVKQESEIVNHSPTLDCVTHFWCDPVGLRQSEEKGKKENVPKETVPKENVPKENVPKENVLKEYVPKENIPKENIPKAVSRDSKGREIGQGHHVNPSSLVKTQVRFPSSVQLAPYGLLCSLLSPLSLGPGCMFFWSRAFFEYNLLTSLPRLTFSQPSRKERRRNAVGVTRSATVASAVKSAKSPKETPAAVMTTLVMSSPKKPMEPTPVPRRGRGRPRKYPLATNHLQIPTAKKSTGPAKKTRRPLHHALAKPVKAPRSKTLRLSVASRPKPSAASQNAARRRSAATSKQIAAERRIGKRDAADNPQPSAWPKIPTERQAHLAAQKDQHKASL